MSMAGVLLTVFGIIFMALLGGGLMTLMFYSSRSGHDESVDRDNDGGETGGNSPDRREP